MKRSIGILLLTASSLYAQKPQQKPVPPAQPDTVQQQLNDLKLKDEIKDIDLAIANFQLAAQQAQIEVDKHLDPLRKAITDAADKAKESRHLDDSFVYDPQKHDFVKKPEQPQSSNGTAPPSMPVNNGKQQKPAQPMPSTSVGNQPPPSPAKPGNIPKN